MVNWQKGCGLTWPFWEVAILGIFPNSSPFHWWMPSCQGCLTNSSYFYHFTRFTNQHEARYSMYGFFLYLKPINHHKETIWVQLILWFKHRGFPPCHGACPGISSHGCPCPQMFLVTPATSDKPTETQRFIQSGQIIMVHQPRFPWNKGPSYLFGGPGCVRSL